MFSPKNNLHYIFMKFNSCHSNATLIVLVIVIVINKVSIKFYVIYLLLIVSYL